MTSKTRKDVVLSVAGALLLFAVASSVLAQTGVLSGTVAEEASRQPVAAANVRISGTNLSAVTNAVGRFQIENVPAGSAQLMVKASGFVEIREMLVQIPPGGKKEVQILLRVVPTVMERIQVTATKEALSVGEVAALTNLVDTEQTKRQGDVKLTQAIQNVPGLISSPLVYSFESVMLRGMPRTGNEWTTTLLMIDGVPQTDSRNSSRVINLPIDDMRSIEVVRGPNSALYGRTAIGGAVNVLTADPTADPEGRVEIQGGGFGHLKGTLSLSGPIHDWGGYYISAADGRNHGFYKQSYDFKSKLSALFGKVTVTPDKKSVASVSINDVLSDNGTPTPDPVINGRLLSDIEPRFNVFTNINVPTSNYHQKEFRSTLNYTRLLSARADFNEVFGYRKIRYQFQQDGDVIGSPFDLTQHTFTMYPFEQITDEKILYEEARVGFRPTFRSIENSLIAGVVAEQTTGFSSGNLIYTDPDTLGWPINYLNPVHPDRSQWQFFPFGGNDYKLGILAGYGQIISYPTTRLILNLGGRYDRLSLRNIQTFKANKPRITDEFHAFSPKASVTFKLIEGQPSSWGKTDLNVYATYSKAFLPPRTPSGLTPPDQGVALVPENIKNYEAGFKGSIGSVSFDGAYFQMRRNGIVVQTREGPFFRNSNAGIQKFKGTELSLTWLAHQGVTMYANAAFYHNRFGTFVIQRSSGDTVLTGNRLPISPDQVFNAGASWSDARGFGSTVNVKHVGGRYLDQINSFLLKAYTVLDASIFWEKGPMRLTLAGHNLTNVTYFNMGDISVGQSADPSPPRQFLAIASYRFR